MMTSINDWNTQYIFACAFTVDKFTGAASIVKDVCRTVAYAQGEDHRTIQQQSGHAYVVSRGYQHYPYLHGVKPTLKESGSH